MRLGTVVAAPLAVVVLLTSGPRVLAQEPEKKTAEEMFFDIADYTLEQLLDAKTSVATKKSKSARESPGILTVITQEEMVNAGARDLIDVLRLIPGFHFGTDVQGVVGAGFRGNWGHEGKILLLLDGQEMNELMYSTLQFGNHFPIDQLERVEIIRGPGSAIYGGFAELAVINLVSRSAARLNGVRVSALGGTTARTISHSRLSLAAGKELSDKLAITASAHLGYGLRSDRQFRDVYDQSYSMIGDSAMFPAQVNVGARVGDLKLRFLYDDYRFNARDGYDAAQVTTTANAFTTLVADAQYEAKLSDRLTLMPRLNYRVQRPWGVDQQADNEFLNGAEPYSAYYAKTAQRLLASLAASYDALDTLNVLVGLEGYVDRAHLHGPEVGFNAAFSTGQSVAYQNVAAYAQVLWDTPIVNVTAGARVESHSAFGPSFVPRIGLTKVLDRFHAKLLWSNAFRAPSIENINLSTAIRPERTRVFEAEVGYQLTELMHLSLNAFDITIWDPIVYFYDVDTEGYRNEPLSGSRGIELEYRVKSGPHYAMLAYALALTAGKNQVPDYDVPGDPNAVVGLPNHKISAHGSVNVWKGLAINPSLVWVSQRSAYLSTDVDGNYVLGALSPTLLLNVFLAYKDLGIKGLDLSVGVHNLLNQNMWFAQPSAQGHAPLPDLSREFIARVTYQYTFN